MFKVKHRRWKNYSGPSISGTTKFILKKESTHWERVVWLTSYVESGGKFGAITMYDGTSITAGITQCVLTYPKELAHEDNNPEDDQGPLWEMLEYIRDSNPKLTKKIEEEFLECGWVLKGGCLRVINEDGSSGAPVNGRLIREELTPNQGRVPQGGDDWLSAKNWALMFHDVFVHPDSFEAQVQFGIDHALKATRRRPSVLKGKTISSLVYNDNPKDTKLFKADDPMDLAMAVLFSNAVNAPAMAFRKLKQAFDVFGGAEGKRPNWQSPRDRLKFAKRLVRVLGTANYARWNFKIASGRYQRTRKAAVKVWPSEMFRGREAVMPRRL